MTARDTSACEVHTPWHRAFCRGLVVVFLAALGPAVPGAEPAKKNSFAGLANEYTRDVQPLLKQYCITCHSTAKQSGELDLERFATLNDVRQGLKAWLKVVEMLDNGEMPPKEAKQPTAEQRKKLRGWVERYLNAEAAASAGDPGPVVLRRLSNAEYTYTIRDLTGVVSLNPARDFPIDGAAGEGFTNTGSALVMSPSLVTKYLDAAKDIAAHAVLLPDGFRFSQDKTASDWTNESLAEIREFYRRFSDRGEGDKLDRNGILVAGNQGGQLPVARYLRATIEERDGLSKGTRSIEAVAKEHGLNAKYLEGLWRELSQNSSQQNRPPSFLMDRLRARWKAAKPTDAAALANEIAEWQKTLWRFTRVGHIGKVGGPKAWIERIDPLVAKQDFRLRIPAATTPEVVIYLSASDAGDHGDHDFVLWERPRLVAPGRPDLMLRDVREVARDVAARRQRMIASSAKCLGAATEASRLAGCANLPILAQKHGVDTDDLAAWIDYLGIGVTGSVQLGTPLTRKIEKVAGYETVKGWIGDGDLSVLANSSDQHLRIPGNLKPHSVAVHPSPKKSVAVGWKSPTAATLTISGSVLHAHAECGNGIAWSLELRRGNTRQRLASGLSQRTKAVPFGPFEKISVQAQDVVSLVINPHKGEHVCDLTAIDLTIRDGTNEWNLARDISSDILAGNPHADSQGRAGIWHFYSEPANGATDNVIPAGTLLARWQTATTAAEKSRLAEQVQKLLVEGIAALPKDSPDGELYRQLTSLAGPLLASRKPSGAAPNPVRLDAKKNTRPDQPQSEPSKIGLDATLFGKHPNGSDIDSASLCVQAPSVIKIRLPSELVSGAEFVVSGTLDPKSGKEGSVQLDVSTTKPDFSTGLRAASRVETTGSGSWDSSNHHITHTSPIIVTPGSESRQRFEASFEDFRKWFPPALCYTKIVPVDEVVTLTLFYREDDHLQRLMLNESEKKELDRLWHNLYFVSQEPLTAVDAFLQLMEYATQDGDPKAFEPLRKPIQARAAAFRKEVLDAEPRQVDALIEFASQAFRRPLNPTEGPALRSFYRHLRDQKISHDEAFRLTLARVFVSPAFLYRLEKAPAGNTSAPVSDAELANRLSYFLWSSQPDKQLQAVAASGRLREPLVLKAQAKRMLADPRTRRLASEFACQWLHIYDFDSLDEKSEKFFPEFIGLRGDMYEESILFFTDLFQRDGSVLSLFNADHTFVNERLAKFYGIPGVRGPQWRRVEGVRKHGRGGILGLSTTLAKQSGASRTSPILRGNWVSEALLGEKLPKPPKDVPRLPDDETSTAGLSVRQLIEMHSSNPKCSSCHQKIDHFGFALEGFDTIGRRRDKDIGGRHVDTKAKFPDGSVLNGLDGLRDYLVNTRRDTVLRQFCRKLLGYALGRGIQLSDEPLLTEMQHRLAKNDYRFSAAVEAILESRQFREIRGRDAQVVDSR